MQSRSNLSRTSSKPLLPTQEEAAAAGLIEMIDEAIQTEVIVPEKKELDPDMETAIRRLSLDLIPEDAIKDIDSTDLTTNWVRAKFLSNDVMIMMTSLLSPLSCYSHLQHF